MSVLLKQFTSNYITFSIILQTYHSSIFYTQAKRGKIQNNQKIHDMWYNSYLYVTLNLVIEFKMMA